MAEFAPTFRFKQFAVTDRRCGMKVGTDGVLLGAWCGCPDATGSTVLDVGAVPTHSRPQLAPFAIFP